MEECGRHLDVLVEILPGLSEFEVILHDVLIVAVHPEHVAHAGAARRRFEPRIRGDHAIGENATVAPSANAQPSFVHTAALDQMVHHPANVADFLVAPITGDGNGVCTAASGAAPIVGSDHRPALGGEQFFLEVEAEGILSGRAAVNAHDERQLRIGRGTGGAPQDTMHHIGIIARRLYFFDVSESDAGQPIIVVGELPRAGLVNHKKFARLRRRGGEYGEPTIGRTLRVTEDVRQSAHDAIESRPVGAHPDEIFPLIVGNDTEDRFPIAGPAGAKDGAVERGSEHAR